MVLVDFVRNMQRKVGTTVACREGDCGACTLLIGRLNNDSSLSYQTITSCISPLSNIAGCHVVTIEGITPNNIQTRFEELNATQCGFCTPGFIISLFGYFLNSTTPTFEGAIAAIDGNICRCTGYKSIERAIQSLITSAPINQIAPSYFSKIPERLRLLKQEEHSLHTKTKNILVVSGGTDLCVQNPNKVLDTQFSSVEYEGIQENSGECIIGAATSIAALASSPLLIKAIPKLPSFLKLFGSTQIRNQGSVGGNIVNASPIGDITNILLALDAKLKLLKGGRERELPLNRFYKGYKQCDLEEGELLKEISFTLPTGNSFFNMEKVSKRTYLDIATVTTSIHLQLERSKFTYVRLSAGGIGPIPLLLQKASRFLVGKPLNPETVKQFADLALSEAVPISDVRGSLSYKRTLFRRLIYAHFLICFESEIQMEALL